MALENFSSHVVEDKRRHKRVQYNLPIQYKNLRKSSDLPIGALTKDISQGGVCFKSSEFISLACRMVVEISLPTNPKPIKAISKVAWIRKLSAGDQYELGNQFLDMTREDKDHILNFMNKALNTNR